MYTFSEEFSRRHRMDSDYKEIADAINDAVMCERKRVLQIIHVTDLNCSDINGATHNVLEMVREKVLSGEIEVDYQ